MLKQLILLAAKEYRKSIFWAVFVYFLDTFIFNQGVVAAIVWLIVVVVACFKILAAIFRKNKELMKKSIAVAGIYTLMFAMVVASNMLNNKLAFHRANKLIQACDSYMLKHKQYPDRLEELVPEFISKVPSAKITWMYGNFRYISIEGSHLLLYYAIPPFGRRIYNLDKKRWGFLD